MFLSCVPLVLFSASNTPSSLSHTELKQSPNMPPSSPLSSTVAVLLCLSSLSCSSPTSASLQTRQVSNATGRSSLANFALEKVLSDATPIFGNYGPDIHNDTSNWMKSYPDNTLLVHMNIAGTHDAHTWNYSLATQQSLDHITALNNVTMPSPDIFRCQDVSLIGQLNMGIRAFDLRYAADTTNSTLLFYHSQGLDSGTATIDDVLFGFYHWLDAHPSEVIFLSFQYEGSTKEFASNDATVQMLLYNALTTNAARHYFLQTKDQLGTLGESRGKIILMRRFDLDQLPQFYTNTLPGLHFSPNNWTDNDPDITLVYNTAQNLTAYIEDYYGIIISNGSTAADNIRYKYNATTAHLLKAASSLPEYRDSLFWSFASSENTDNVPIVTPKIMAVGNGSYTPLGGVNQQLVPFLANMTGKRVGIVMFDFFEQPSNLVSMLLSLQAP